MSHYMNICNIPAEYIIDFIDGITFSETSTTGSMTDYNLDGSTSSSFLISEVDTYPSFLMKVWNSKRAGEIAIHIKTIIFPVFVFMVSRN